METTKRHSSGVPDSSPFATARRELWEEAGLWLEWRQRGEFHWVSRDAVPLIQGPGPHQSAFLVTQLQEGDREVDHLRRAWMTLEECAAQGLRRDHLQLLRELDGWVW